MNPTFEIQTLDHIEIATRDIQLSEQLFHKLGFETLDSRTLHERSLSSKLLGQNNLYIILSSSTNPEDPISKFVSAHGDGVFTVTLRTNDTLSALDYVQSKGAKVEIPPKTIQKDFGSVTTASIKGVGSTHIQFLARTGQLFSEGFDYVMNSTHTGFGLFAFDHFSMVVPKGEIKAFKEFLENVLGMKEMHYETSTPQKIYLKYKNFHVVINEPESENSDLAKFVEGHHGAGFDHVAFATKDIFTTLNGVNRSNIPFRKPAPAYYDELFRVRPDLKNKADEISKSHVVVHGTPESEIYQAATHFINGFWFFEFIERRNFEGLGTNAQKILAG